MPTGYTGGIIDGKITTFEEFAKLCIRNFGATLHMRDDPFDAEYKPAEVPSFYKDNIEKYKRELEILRKTSDEDLLINEKIQINKDIVHYLETIRKKKENCKILREFYKKALQYKIPSDEHVNYKAFMVNQLKMTIEQDCNTEFYEKTLKELKERLNNLDVKKIREEKKVDLENDIKYYTKQYNEQKERIEKSNKWVEQVFESLKKC